MRIDLDDNYTIVPNRWGDLCVVKHAENAKPVGKSDKPEGETWWFQTYGQAVVFYLKKVQAGEKKTITLMKQAHLIDAKYKEVEQRINEQMKENKHEN